MFDFDEDPVPRQWADMSLDYRLMFGLHGVAMVLFFLSRFLKIELELAIMTAAWFGAAAVSVSHRIRSGWRWPGAGPKQLFRALISPVAVGIMFFAAGQNFPASNPAILPWYFAGANIALFWVLASLRIVRFSQLRAKADCGGEPAGEIVRAETIPRWKTTVRIVYSVAFAAMWLGGMAFFYLDGRAVRESSPVTTADKTWPITEHGATVFISPQDGVLIGLLMTGFMIGVPVVLAAGFFIQFVLKVPVFGPDPFGLGRSKPRS